MSRCYNVHCNFTFILILAEPVKPASAPVPIPPTAAPGQTFISIIVASLQPFRLVSMATPSPVTAATAAGSAAQKPAVSKVPLLLYNYLLISSFLSSQDCNRCQFCSRSQHWRRCLLPLLWSILESQEFARNPPPSQRRQLRHHHLPVPSLSRVPNPQSQQWIRQSSRRSFNRIAGLCF